MVYFHYMANSPNNDPVGNIPEPDIGRYYDKFDSYDKAAAEARWPERMSRLIGLVLKDTPANPAVLDLGTGTGLAVSAVMEQSEPSRVVAVDLSSKRLAELRAKHPDPRVEIVHQDVVDYVAATHEDFDVITAMSMLEFVADLPAFIYQVAQMLRQNGVFAGTYVPREEGSAASEVLYSQRSQEAIEEHRWLPEVVQQALRNSGLEITHKESFAAYEVNNVVVPNDFFIARKTSS
jgi:cyclopropane fatty-acyl-phospholipid synthase-like methyltransferase